MTTIAHLLLLGLAGGAAASTVRIPGGRSVDPDCIKIIANGALHTPDHASAGSCGKTLVNHAAEWTGDVAASKVGRPEIQIYAADVHFASQTPLTAFTADWVVPPLPELHMGQVVYFWPGFKSQQPEMGYPVLQPVLQFGEHAGKWALQSWFVDARDQRYPVVTAPEIAVSPGDALTSFMSLDAASKTWTVSASNTNTGENSTLRIAYSKAGDCDYGNAMLVNENINVNEKCYLMPKSTNLTFTRVTVNGKQPEWMTRQNCAGNPECDCGNKASVASNGDVTLAWKHKL